MKPNRYRKTCHHCGLMVEKNEGVMLREQDELGQWRSIVTHKGACPPPAKSQNGRSAEQRAFDAMVARQGPVELGDGGPEVARQWEGYMYLRRLRAWPRGMTMEGLDDMIGDADLEAMDAAVAEHRALILAGDWLHEPESARKMRVTP